MLHGPRPCGSGEPSDNSPQEMYPRLPTPSIGFPTHRQSPLDSFYTASDVAVVSPRSKNFRRITAAGKCVGAHDALLRLRDVTHSVSKGVRSTNLQFDLWLVLTPSLTLRVILAWAKCVVSLTTMLSGGSRLLEPRRSATSRSPLPQRWEFAIPSATPLAEPRPPHQTTRPRRSLCRARLPVQ